MLKKEKDGKVTFIFSVPSENPVFLVGDFNNWDTSSLPMERDSDGNWVISLKLDPGAYEFKYYTKIDGQEFWYNDWEADTYHPSPFGGENSVVIID